MSRYVYVSSLLFLLWMQYICMKLYNTSVTKIKFNFSSLLLFLDRFLFLFPFSFLSLFSVSFFYLEKEWTNFLLLFLFSSFFFVEREKRHNNGTRFMASKAVAGNCTYRRRKKKLSDKIPKSIQNCFLFFFFLDHIQASLFYQKKKEE